MMNNSINKWLVYGNLFFYASLPAISMVYNFRIAQITRQPIFDKVTQKKSTIVALIFDQVRKKYNGTRQNFAGELSSFIYDFKSYYVRADFAFAHIHEKNINQSSFSDTETDDILFTAGRNFTLNQENTMTLSGLFGVPTHAIYRLKHVDFGYSQIGIGFQLDGLHIVSPHTNFVYGARYIYFVPRKADDACKRKYHFTIGNVGDLLFALRNKYKEHHGFELGYTLRSRFGAQICPNLDDIVKKSNYLRSNYYIVYKYKFLIGNIPNRLLFNCSYGF